MVDRIPTVSTDDLYAFHARHFAEHLFPVPGVYPQASEPVPDEAEYQDYEDDGLGYYPDGTKRTLTDEQIAMFRHSEIQQLLKARRQLAKKRQNEQEEEEYRKKQRQQSPEKPVEDTAKDAAKASPKQVEPAQPISLPKKFVQTTPASVVENPAPTPAPQGRLAASLWASQHDWSNISTRPAAQPSAPLHPTAPIVHPKNGQTFLWPKLGDDDQ